MLTTPHSTPPQYPSLVSTDTVVVVHGLGCVVYHGVGHPWTANEVGTEGEVDGCRGGGRSRRLRHACVCLPRPRSMCLGVFDQCDGTDGAATP